MKLPLESAIHPWPDVVTPLGSLAYAGILITDQGWGLQTMRTLEFYSFGLLLEGGGRYRDARGVDMRVKPGDCIWVEPGCEHQYGCEPGDTWSEVYLCFRGDPFAQWQQRSRLQERRVISLKNPEAWASHWLSLANSSPRNFYETVTLLAEIHLLINNITSAPEQEWSFEERLDASRQHLRAWPHEQQPDWQALASGCGCSYETWRKAFKKHYGQSPARFRRSVMMEQAAMIMMRSSMTNEQLAEYFGCSDGFHFSKLFKSVKQMSPREYRNRMRA